MGDHEAPREPIFDELKRRLGVDDDPDHGHILPDDEWAQVVADAEAHPENPNHKG